MTIGGQPIRVVAPTSLPVSLAEAKTHLRVTHSDEDAMIAAYLRAAVARAEEFTGLGLLQQTWQQTFPAFANPMLLYRRPLLQVGSPLAAVQVTFLDTAGALQTLDPGVVVVTGIGAAIAYGAVRLGYGQMWPTVYSAQDAVTITYTIGFGTTASSVPETIREAILVMVTDRFENRGSMHEGSVDELPFGAEALLRQWRPLAVA